MSKDYDLEDLKRELARREAQDKSVSHKTPVSTPAHTNSGNYELSDLYAELARREALESQSKGNLEPSAGLKKNGVEYLEPLTVKEIKKSVAQTGRVVPGAIGGILDLAAMPSDLVSERPIDKGPFVENGSFHKKFTKVYDDWYGEDLTPRTTGEKVFNTAGEILATPGIGMIKGVKAVAQGAKAGLKALPPLVKKLAEEGAGALGMSTAVHATPRITDEGSPAGFVEDIVKGNIGAKTGRGVLNASGSIYKKFFSPKDTASEISEIFKNAPSLTSAEKRVAEYLQKSIGEKLGTVSKNIEEAPKYPATKYEPMTAELANDSLMSQLHRLRQGVPSTGMAEHSGIQNERITEVANKLSVKKSSSDKVKDVVGKELSEREKVRAVETKPLYDEVKADKTQINPEHTHQFFKINEIVKGDKRKDLEWVRELIKPSKKLTKEELFAQKRYKQEEKSILENYSLSGSAKKQALSKLKKPPENHPTVGDLDEARQNINGKIKKLTKFGEDHRVRLLQEAKDALDKDLSVAPTQSKATATYAALSKPVNDILEHPAIGKLPESRKNNIFKGLFDENSTDNFTALKKVLKPKDWEGVQHASVDYMMKSVRNAGAEGRGYTLSHNKLEGFLGKHETALKVILDKDQLRFVNELRNALKGRNRANTLGLEPGSQTYGKLITGTHLNDGIIKKSVHGASKLVNSLPIPKISSVGDYFIERLNKYLKNQESDVMAVLDKVLKNPDYAHVLLNYKFRDQHEFNKFMRQVAKDTSRMSAPIFSKYTIESQ